tara:strand:+ start:207 stop:320 length:114 start_codon:yes stop_codon:yes gene_type:complete
MTDKLKPIYDSFQEYIESENMIFITLHESMTIANKDK